MNPPRGTFRPGNCRNRKQLSPRRRRPTGRSVQMLDHQSGKPKLTHMHVACYGFGLAPPSTATMLRVESAPPL